MKRKKRKNLLLLLAFITIAAATSSCNRGMGCPTFSIDAEKVINVVSVIAINE